MILLIQIRVSYFLLAFVVAYWFAFPFILFLWFFFGFFIDYLVVHRWWNHKRHFLLLFIINRCFFLFFWFLFLLWWVWILNNFRCGIFGLLHGLGVGVTVAWCRR